MKIFGRHPIVWLTAIQSALALAVATPFINLDPNVAAWLLTVTSAILAAVEAFAVRPMTPAALAGAIRTLLTAVVLFGFPVTEDFATALVGFATLVYGFLVVPTVTPAADPDRAFLMRRAA